MIKILLWVECGPYVVYGKREQEMDPHPSYMKELYEGMEERKLV